MNRMLWEEVNGLAGTGRVLGRENHTVGRGYVRLWRGVQGESRWGEEGMLKSRE